MIHSLDLVSRIGFAAMSASLSIVGAASAAELALTPDAPDALIVGEAPTTVAIAVTAGAAESGHYEIRQRFVDRYAVVTELPPVEFTLEEFWTRKVEVPVEHFGPVTFEVALHKAGEEKPVAHAEQMLVRTVPLPRLSQSERAASPMGINLHKDAHWDTLAAMGIHWARDYSWGWLKHGDTWPVASNGTDFTGLVERADRAGITILPVRQQSFRTADKKAFIEDTDLIARSYEKLSRANPTVEFWELDNEADLEHRDQDTAEYRKWLETYIGYIQAADRGLDAAGHGAKVVLNGEAGIHPQRTRELLERVGDHFAVVNYHFYTGTVAPELARHDINTGAENRPQGIAFLDQLREINAIAHAAGKQAWLTEIGWSARSGPAIGDRLQSAYFARMYMLARWGGTDKTFWFWDRELDPKSRFSSTEFVHSKEGARAVGAAAAAVSKFTALSAYAGSVDIGRDRWCLAFRRPEGGWVIGAWSVTGEHDLPAELAPTEQAFDMYGNPLRDRTLTAEPAYFVLPELPAAWQGQLEVEWLSPRFLAVRPGAEYDAELRMSDGASLRWEGLPEHVQGASLSRSSDGKSNARLTLRPQAVPGEHEVFAAVQGDGWTKRFPVTLNILPALDVEPEPYTSDGSSEVLLTNRIDRPINVALTADAGRIEPQNVAIEPGATATVAFTPPHNAAKPMELRASWDDGATQTAWARPRELTVPRVENLTIDGDLSDWPTDGGELVGHALKVNGPLRDFAPRMRLAWSPQGLYLAAEIPVGPDFAPPMQPDYFWEWTSVEMNLNAADAGSEPGAERSHLLWFTPTRDSNEAPWRVYAGEWLKPMPDGKKETLKDDRRSRTAASYDGQTVRIEALIPVDVLGAAPQAGHVWPLTIHAKVAKALSPRTLAVWPAGRTKGQEGWGRVRFAD